MKVVSPANFNTVGQTVIAGQTSAVDRAIGLAKEKGAKIAKRIPVSVPSHCALMEPATKQLAKKLKTINIGTPKIPIISNVDVSIHTEVDQIRDALVEQLVYPVRWVETVLSMQEKEIELFIECGPGRVLAGLNKRILKITPTKTINTPDCLRTVVESLKEE